MAKVIRGIDFVAEMLQFCDTKTQTRLVNGLIPILEKEQRLDLVAELKNQLILFEDLAYANNSGIAILLKYVSIRDLAMALKGAPESVIKNISQSMSKNQFNDLMREVAMQKNATNSEVLMARDRILKEVKKLIGESRLYIDKPTASNIY